ncbi:MAG: hypothetical protein LUG96_03090 [Tannerellaceae bacterium]|nr:hypothetical protein [Tannerellaceae bacterium]
MQKILLGLFACTTALFSFANSYDTLYVKGGDPVFHPLGMTQEQVEAVEWFIGDPEG